jgi:asparagine synthetase B (glutamine-hydrolysing)
MILKSDFSGSGTRFFDDTVESSMISNFFSTHKKINPSAIYDFLLYGAVLPPHSPLQEVSSLYPGEKRGGNQANIELSTLDLSIKRKGIDYFVEALDGLLRGYFDASSQKDKTLLLSGGIDSAILLSYLGKDTHCITWGGWGEKTTDVIFSKKTAEKFGVNKHDFVYASYEEDMNIYKELIKKIGLPILFSNAIPYIRMARLAQKHHIQEWYMGQNADTIFLSYPPIVYVRKLIFFNSFLPINPLLFSHHRKKYLFSTKSPVRLMAYFKSGGIYPGSWIHVPKNYFEEKEEVVREVIPKGKTTQKIIFTEQLFTEARRNQLYQSQIPALFGIKTHCPYYQKEIVQLALHMPERLLMKDNYDKLILKKLAQKRGVPNIIIEKGKKGLSYNSRSILEQRLHVPVWNAMERDDFLNHFIDVSSIRSKMQENYFAFDILRSLYMWGQLVVKPQRLSL